MKYDYNIHHLSPHTLQAGVFLSLLDFLDLRGGL